MRVGEPPEPVSELETYEPVLQVGQMAKAIFGCEGLNGVRSAHGETFYALLMGTLISAVNDYVRYKDSTDPKKKERARMAWIWLFAEVDPRKDDVLGSFQWVCMVLDRDPTSSRERIRKMSVADLPKVDRRKG